MCSAYSICAKQWEFEGSLLYKPNQTERPEVPGSPGLKVSVLHSPVLLKGQETVLCGTRQPTMGRVSFINSQFLQYIFKFYLFSYFMCRLFCLSVHHVCALFLEGRGGIGSHGTRISGGCELPYGYWEQNLGSLEGQSLLLTTEWPLQLSVMLAYIHNTNPSWRAGVESQLMLECLSQSQPLSDLGTPSFCQTGWSQPGIACLHLKNSSPIGAQPHPA